MKPLDPANDAELRVIQDRETLLTPETFEALGHALQVKWPAWYRTFIWTLLQAPLSRDFWLAPGWLYGRPGPIWESTQQYRTGVAQLCRETEVPCRGEPVPWPATYVVVGDVNAGDPIMIDTGSDEWVFSLVDHETGIPTLLMDGSDFANTPRELALALVRGARRADQAREMEIRMKWEVERMRNDPGYRPSS